MIHVRFIGLDVVIIWTFKLSQVTLPLLVPHLVKCCMYPHLVKYCMYRLKALRQGETSGQIFSKALKNYFVVACLMARHHRRHLGIFSFFLFSFYFKEENLNKHTQTQQTRKYIL